MKVVFLSPQWSRSYGIFAHFAKRTSLRQPLNLAYLAAVTEQAGHEAAIIDGELEGLSPQAIAEAALRLKPDIVGITAVTPTWHLARATALRLKALNPKLPIAVGGPHVTLLQHQAFDPFDYAFIGEAEESGPIFLERFQRGVDFSDVKGIIYRDRRYGALCTGKADPVNLDTLPLPARHLLKMDRYRIGTPRGMKKFTLIQASRGCPYQCSFCATGVMGREVRQRSVDSVLGEICHVMANYHISHFFFADDNLTLKREWMLELCAGMRREGPVTFEGSTRANLLDEELVAKMAEAGLVRLYLGLESVDPEVRRLAHKDSVTVKHHEDANRWCRKYGVEAVNHVMIGLPGETRRTAERTIDYVARNRDIPEVTLSVAVPYPGTELLEMARRGEHGLRLITEDWSKFYRYGSAVMGVNDLSPKDLVAVQSDGIARIYLRPWRWRSVYRTMGLMGCLLTLLRVVKYLGHRIAILPVKPEK